MEKLDITASFDEIFGKTTPEYNSESATVIARMQELFPELFDIGGNYNDEVNCNTSKITNTPKLIEQIVQTIKKRYPGVTTAYIKNVINAMVSQYTTMKRIKYIEANNCDSAYPNYYAINFMPSGAGKDRVLKDLKKFFYCYLEKEFNFDVETYLRNRIQKIEKEAKEKYPNNEQEKQRNSYINTKEIDIDKPTLETSDGTREGVYRDAKALKEAGFGSLTIVHSEFGQLLNNPTHEQEQFLKLLFSGYDGKITSKSIKGEKKKEDITDIPVNLLVHSDPTLFCSDLKQTFNSMLESGVCRRSSITFADKIESYEMQQDPKKALEEQRQYFRNLAILGYKLFMVLEKVKFGAQFKMTNEAFEKVLYPYMLELKALMDKEENSLIKKEIMSREFKAIKLSCNYACINHPNEHFINTEDMNMAISNIEELSKDFYKFISYAPKYEDKYDRGFRFFLEHEGISFKKSELITDYRQHFGISREKFKNCFDEYMKVVKSIAVSKGYLLNEILINHNSGSKFTLIPLKKQKLSDFVTPLEDLL